MESLWENMRRGLQQGVSAAAARAEELTRVGRARLDIAAVKGQIRSLQADLGAEVYRRIDAEEDGGAVVASDAVRELCEQLSALEEELQGRETELELLRVELAEVREGKIEAEEDELSSEAE